MPLRLRTLREEIIWICPIFPSFGQERGKCGLDLLFAGFEDGERGLIEAGKGQRETFSRASGKGHGPEKLVLASMRPTLDF